MKTNTNIIVLIVLIFKINNSKINVGYKNVSTMSCSRKMYK